MGSLHLITTLIFLAQHTLGQTEPPPKCGDYSGCLSCVTQTEVSHCGYCPSTGLCIDTWDSTQSCSASASVGQLSYNQGDCECLEATSCEDMTSNNLYDYRGFCPYHNKCFQGDGNGPYDDIDCPRSADDGQWINNDDDCKCLSAPSCEYMNDNNLYDYRGWCPYHGKCFQGDGNGPYDDIECPRNVDKGQWVNNYDDCQCLSVTTCFDMTNNNLFDYRGFCPYHGKCFQGDGNGPYDDIKCPRTVDKGQWINNDNDCKCLHADSCEYMNTNNLFDYRGWCPYHGKCFQGDGNAPYDGPNITCPRTVDAGQWVNNYGDCRCLEATSCEDMNDWDLFDYRGFCPYHGKCFQGDGNAPYDAPNITCPRTVAKGQWINNYDDCQCLEAKSCNEMNEKDLFHWRGWCPFHGKCFQGDGNGPYDGPNITCPRTIDAGQWIDNYDDCQCLESTSCEEMNDLGLFNYRGWCPYHGKCFQGDGNGPYDAPNITCPRNADKGQWVSNHGDCQCLSSTSCEDMADKSLYDYRGWCPFHNKCFQGDGNGPYDGLNCPAGSITGQWISGNNDCSCLSTSTCEEATSLSGYYGWCSSNKKCYQGNGNEPYDDIKCSSWLTDSDSCDNKCAENCVKCDSSTLKCTECKSGYNGKYCQYNIAQCNVCKESTAKTMEAGAVAAGAADCIELFEATFESCGTAGMIGEAIPIIGTIATTILDPIVCTAAGYEAYSLCDKTLELPAEKYCQSVNMCPSDSDDRRRLYVTSEPYPYWPFEFWTEGVQYSQNTILNFRMGYSYSEDLMYSQLTNQEHHSSSYYVLKNNTNYHFHKNSVNGENNTCNYSTGAITLSESNYLNSYLQSIGVDRLIYNGTLKNNKSISRWHSPICRNINDSSNSANNATIECGIDFYYYDVVVKNENNETIYRKPLYTTIDANGNQITTEFHVFRNNISDSNVFDEAPYHCLPTNAPTANPTNEFRTTPTVISEQTDMATLINDADSATATNQMDDDDDDDSETTIPMDKNNNDTVVITVVIIVIVILLVITGVLVFICWSRKKEQKPFTTNLDYQMLEDEPINSNTAL